MKHSHKRYTRLKKIKLKLLRKWEAAYPSQKKPVHVQIHDEEEKEEYDEKDKADYERNKQFEKLIADTVAMKEKMKKMQLVFRQAQGMDDCL